MNILKKSLLIILLSITFQLITTRAVAQCAGRVYVSPTSVSCDCVLASCGSGGDEINGHYICGNVASGGTNCTSVSVVIGVTKTCTSEVNLWAILECGGEALGCFLVCVYEPPACLPCLAVLAGETGTGEGCLICGNILTCTTATEDIWGLIYDSQSGTCPPS